MRNAAVWAYVSGMPKGGARPGVSIPTAVIRKADTIMTLCIHLYPFIISR